jgi:predicted secreted protein
MATRKPKVVAEEAIVNVEEVSVDTAPEVVAEEVKPVEESKEVKAEEVVVEKQKSAPVKESNKRVVPNTTYTTNIGGQYYHFKKGVAVDVPPNVKRIMLEGGMLAPQ